MAQTSGFFNALLVNGEYDRKYNADNYSDNMAVVISDGVIRSITDSLKVTASGLIPTVAIGRAWIKGHWYKNDTALALTAIVPPTGGSRYDRVVLRFDNNLVSRKIEIAVITGTAAATPTKPDITRTDDVYDLVLADILVAANASTMTVTDMRGDSSVCGWVYSTSGDDSFFTSLDGQFNEWFQEKKEELSSVTLFKRYTWTSTLASATQTVAFSIPQYDEDTCFIEVYVNGIQDYDFTRSGNVLTFGGTLTAGTKVVVHAYKSIDGTGIMDVADEITELQNQYATLSGVSKYTYKCTGANDNISLSQIAQAIYTGSYVAANVNAAAAAFLTALGGNTWLASLTSDAQITIHVAGKLGATTPFAGTGASASPYQWFTLGPTATQGKRVVFDFAKCEDIDLTCVANKQYYVFYGTDLFIRNATVNAHCSGVNCPISMIEGASYNGKVNVDFCRFEIATSGRAYIARNGVFTECHCKVTSESSHAYCFYAISAGLIRVNGGVFYAYKKTSSMNAAIFYTLTTETDAVIMAANVSCPTVARTGYTQQYLSVAGAGATYIYGVVSTQTSTGSYNNINGQVWKSKF